MEKQIKLSNTTARAIGDWTGSTVKSDKAKIKAVDSLHADGVKADMLKAPDKGSDRTFYESVLFAITTGFSAAVQTLLKKETKSLSDSDKQEKRYWQMQQGSKMKDLRNALTRRESANDGSDGAGSKHASWEASKRKVLADMISQAQKKEKHSIKDMAEFIKALQAALAQIPANA